MNDDYVDVSEMMKLCGIVRRKTMHDSYIAPALADGSIERKYPEQLNHPKQMYRLKEMAKIWKKLDTPIRDKIAISCMLRQIHEFSSHAIRHGLYIKNRKRLFCP